MDDKKHSILDNVAPCGLVCYACNGCNHGIIKELIGKLLGYLDGYDDYVTKSWPDDSNIIKNSMQVLKHWESLDCPGCRHEDHQCHNQNCHIRSCTREKGFDFCAECVDFPCDKVDEKKTFTDFWIAGNTRIRDAGVEKYFEEQKDKSLYTRFKF